MSPADEGEAVGAWGPVVLWAAGIIVVTTVPVPGGTGRDLAHLDKLGHAAMYSGLGWTVARALHRTGRSTTGALVLAAVAAAGFAGLDEWHQGWVGRDPALADWAADAVGLAAGLGLFLWLRRDGGTEEESEGVDLEESHHISTRDGEQE